MEKTTKNILIVFFVSLLSLTAIQFYLLKTSPASVLGSTDVRGCYLLHGYCSDSTRCPSTYDAYFNPQGFLDCKLKACCVKKGSYSPLSSSPTPTSVPTRTPTPDYGNSPTPITLTTPDYSMNVDFYPALDSFHTIIAYSINIKGNNTPGGSKRLSGNCWYRKLLSSGQWGQWTPFDPFYTVNTAYQNAYQSCWYELGPYDQIGDTFEFAGGVTVFYDLNRNGRLDADEPGPSCNGTDSNTRGNTCQNKRVRFTMADVTRLTPTPAPTYQVESFSLRTPCGLDAFRNADYRCRTGASGSLGETSSCKPVSVWWSNVYQICNSPQPTPTR